ncbi:MAG: MarR family transcriptional regulator [Lewinellaceae bacterium]|nr:MarR family transcriptional regulator [Phaeodactylibacter sp.]MCB9035849.1 MarR family transcriptional regulator [Lewinellaceae bacterium]
MASPHHLFRLIAQVHRTRKAAVAGQAELLEKHELSPLDWAILRSLHENPPQSQAGVARSVGRAPSNVRYPIEALYRRGIIQREPDGDDRRVNLTFLSPRGESLVKTLLPAFQSVDQALLNGLSAGEQQELERLLQTILKNTRES